MDTETLKKTILEKLNSAETFVTKRFNHIVSIYWVNKQFLHAQQKMQAHHRTQSKYKRAR